MVVSFGRSHSRSVAWGVMKRIAPIVVLAALVLVSVVVHGCKRDTSPRVVLYVSADEHFARQVIAEFTKQTGIRVDFVGDTEDKKTTGLVQRIRNEKSRPRADVFWSSENVMTMALAEEGLLEPFESESTKAWPTEHSDAGNRWFAFAARARVIVYAPDRVAEDERPRTWMDLSQSRYRGRIVMADPRFGTTGTHLGAMRVYWERAVQPGFYEAWLLGLAENKVQLLPGGNAAVVRAIAEGQADLGMTDTDDVWAAIANGLKVDMIYARHDALDATRGAGTLLIPNTVARVTGGPNPDSASRLIDFLLSETTERMLAESDSRNVPLRPGLAEAFPALAVPDPLMVDWKRAAAARNLAVDDAMRMLSGSPSSDAR